MTIFKTFTSSDVTLAVLNFNGADLLPALFESICDLNHAPGEIFIVDDGSTDGGGEAIVKQYPDVRFISMGKNTGMLNSVRNRAFQASRCRLLFIVDNDVVLRPDCVDELIRAFNTLPDVAACITRAVNRDDQESIYQDGQTLHYVGSSSGINRNAKVYDVSDEPRVSIGWGVQMIDKERAQEVGFFNEDYLMGWGDDGELNYKLNLRGYKCYQIPKAVVVHNRAEGSKRYLGTVYNRLRFITEMYRLRTIFMVSPALLVYEAALIAFLSLKGAVMDYFRGWGYYLNHFTKILRVRKQVQSYRRLPDNEVMGSDDIFVYSDYLNNIILTTGYRSLNLFLHFYWKIVKSFV